MNAEGQESREEDKMIERVTLRLDSTFPHFPLFEPIKVIPKKVTSIDGKTEYIQGVDYWIMEMEGILYIVSVLHRSAIHDGQEVLLISGEEET